MKLSLSKRVKQPGPGTVSLAEYHRMEDALNARIKVCHDTIAAIKQERDAARIQAEANAADAILWRTARAKRRRKPVQQEEVA